MSDYDSNIHKLMLDVADTYAQRSFNQQFYAGRQIPAKIKDNILENIQNRDEKGELLCVLKGALFMTTHGIYKLKYGKPEKYIAWDKSGNLECKKGKRFAEINIGGSNYVTLTNDDIDVDKKLFISLFEDIHTIANTDQINNFSVDQYSSMKEPRWVFRYKDKLCHVTDDEGVETALKEGLLNLKWSSQDLSSNEKQWNQIDKNFYRKYGLNYVTVRNKLYLRAFIAGTFILGILSLILYSLITTTPEYYHYMYKLSGAENDTQFTAYFWQVLGAIVATVVMFRIHPVLGILSVLGTLRLAGVL